MTPDGAVYYGLKRDDLMGLGDGLPEGQDLVVPAREIIHDQMLTLFHPLIGIPPLYACGLAAQQGLTMSQPVASSSSAPGVIPAAC